MYVPILMVMYGKSVGGAELQFIELANYLANTHKVRLISLGGDGAVRSTNLDQRIELQVFSYGNVFAALIALLKALFCCVRYPSNHVVTTSFIGNFIGYTGSLFRMRRKISLQTVSKCMRHPVLDRFVLSRFDVLVAGASDIGEYLVSHGQDKNRIRVIHNWVDFSKRIPSESVAETRAKLGISDQVVIGCIGRLHRQKGQFYLIRAFSRIAEIFPNMLLLLLGDGPTREELGKEVKSLRLAEKVIFCGTVTGDGYNNILSIIDIYVQPSIFEGLPRTLLDAMYMAKPIVASDINGNREAIEHEVNGLLTPPENPEALFEAISRLLRRPDEGRQFALAAQRDASHHFGIDQKLGELSRLIFGTK